MVADVELCVDSQLVHYFLWLLNEMNRISRSFCNMIMSVSLRYGRQQMSLIKYAIFNMSDFNMYNDIRWGISTKSR